MRLLLAAWTIPTVSIWKRTFSLNKGREKWKTQDPVLAWSVGSAGFCAISALFFSASSPFKPS